MSNSILCVHIDPYIFLKGAISVANTGGVIATVSNEDKKVIFENCSPFTDCISEIDNVVTSMHNLIEYSDSYSKRSGSLW